MKLPKVKNLYGREVFTFMDEPFRLREVAPTSSGWHVVFHDNTEADFRYNDEIAYPYLGKPKNHVGQNIRIFDLYAGDMINSHNFDEESPWAMYGEDAWFKELDYETREKESRIYTAKGGAFQVVRFIYAGWMITEEMTGANPKHRAYRVDNGRRFDIGFENHTWADFTEKEPTEPKEAEFFGPYYWQNNRDDEPTYFAKHPYGKGKWPGWIQEYAPGVTGQSRPPRTDAKRTQENKQPLVNEWKLWGHPKEDEDGFKPHPADPRFKKREGWHPYGNPRARNKRLTGEVQ